MISAITTGGDVIRSGAKALLLATGIALFVFFRESSSPEARRRRVRIWTWGTVGLIGLASVVAIVFGGIMLGTGTRY